MPPADRVDLVTDATGAGPLPPGGSWDDGERPDETAPRLLHLLVTLVLGVPFNLALGQPGRYPPIFTLMLLEDLASEVGLRLSAHARG